MRVYKLAGVVWAAFLATTASATTLQPLGYDGTAGMQVDLKVNGNEVSEWAGPFDALLNGSKTIEVFCVDFFTSIDYQQYTVSINNAPFPGNLQAAAQLYSTFIGQFNSAPAATRALYGAAMQLALWDVVIDGTGSGLSAGNFQQSSVKPMNVDLANIVSSYVTSALGPVAPGVVIYDSASKDVQIQKLIGPGGEVPEPGTFALLGAGLLVISMYRRRNA